MTRAFNPADPHATPMTDGQPYRVERRVLAGIPCLLELPPEEQPLRGLCVVHHGAGANKEGKLGVYAALTAAGLGVVLPDGALHGERQGDTPEGLNAREYVWESVRRTVAEAPALHGALAQVFGPLPLDAVGSSMGGYVVLTLARLGGLCRAAALITSGVWHEPEVGRPELRAFLEEHRPNTHAADLPPTPLLLASGDSDPVFALATHHAPTAAALGAAYAAAGCPQAFTAATFEGVGHYTSRHMRDAALAFLRAE
ncbi:S9 family peptidase [Deinococcus sp. Leaf326]|uniref:alpha/beta hydrolase family protein n=1 Tax=Deinococcus sp. Leaf326 TaxID=1736338 RepID=UPI000700E718|nr:hydrolase [Deinococcus sp. Leaf326]KQR40935.1 hydrolase [Deinococcus sp. Leaf326]